MHTLVAGQNAPEVPVNETTDSLSAFGVFARRHPGVSGLTWAWWGGVWGGLTIADGTVALTNGATNYVVVNRATGAVTAATTTTDWNNTATFARAHVLVTAGSAITSVADHRCGLGGTHGQQARPEGVSADRGDNSVILAVGTDATAQRFATNLTAARTITLSTTGARNGDKFRVVRSAVGAGTLDLGGLKTLPAATAAWAEVHFNGTAWVLTAYGTL